MLATSEAPTEPVPPTTMQVCVGAEGWVLIVTAYMAPLATGVAKVKVMAPAGTGRSSPASSCSTRPPPARPTRVPPILYVLVTHETTTPVTAAFVTVPPPLVTVQT